MVPKSALGVRVTRAWGMGGASEDATPTRLHTASFGGRCAFPRGRGELPDRVLAASDHVADARYRNSVSSFGVSAAICRRTMS
jgi:hypothetical protein